MRILFVVPYAPTPIRTRPHNLVRGLARRGHNVTLATLYENVREQDSLHALEREGIHVIAQPLTRARKLRNVLAALPSGAPVQASYCWQPTLAATLHTTLQSAETCFDVVHVEHLRGARYALALNAFAPTVWDSVDCISHLFQQASAHSRSFKSRLMTWFELSRTRHYEAMLTQQFARVLVTSEVDKQALDELSAVSVVNRPSAVVVLPNGVDLNTFAPTAQPRSPDTLVLSGKLSYHANVSAAQHFVRKVLPLIWRERPQTRLWIVGQNPPASVNALTADVRITVYPDVPNMRDYLARASVALCPLVYGAGIQNKVLEAMACATPVVSYASALRAIAAQAERDVLAADEPQAFARQVLRLLADPALAWRVGAAGRTFVEHAHDWNRIVQQLEHIYTEAQNTWSCRPLQQRPAVPACEARKC